MTTPPHAPPQRLPAAAAAGGAARERGLATATGTAVTGGTSRGRPSQSSGTTRSATGPAVASLNLAGAPLPLRVLVRLRDALRWTGVQGAGWLLAGLVVAAWIAGALTGWLEWWIIGAAGLVVLLVAILFTLGRQTYAVTLRLQSEQVVVGERALGDLQVVNTSDRRLLPARIELPVGRRVASFALPSLAGSAAHEEVFAVPTHRRAVISVGPARTVRGDPFGLIARETLWTGVLDLFVHPKTVPLPGREGGFVRDLEGHATNKVTNSDISFHALREYRPGDDRRYVHWKSTAKTGTLLVRQFEETRRSHLAIALDLNAAAYDNDDEFELAVSITGSLGIQAMRDENFLSVLTSTGRLRTPSPMRTLDQLSTVETLSARELRSRRRTKTSRAGAAGAQVFDLARWVMRGEPNASVAAVVTGAAADPTTLRRAGNLFSPDVRVLMMRAELGAPLTVQTTSNVSLLTIGGLRQLPRAIRRASAVDQVQGGFGGAA